MARFGSIAYAPMIESVNRKFVRRQDVVGKNISFAMGGGTRTTAYAGIGPVAKNYMFMRKFGITVAPTTQQMQLREDFGLVAKARAYIKKDLTQIPSVQTLWKQASEDPSKLISGVSAYGRSYNGWIFAVCYARVTDNPEITFDELKKFPTAFDA